ncbi:hypothetical protein [Mycobacterium sp. GA-2829]|uniref:hypothetical protein n=1 Tax=Mycobacterium sp. GA-2829 TaxID=1772283 RepID=UPI0007400F7E|nr:hypothetical protein [Mycobacterium sp. GA-2829]KUI31713.1 hypothetical protein AU194_06940 [Mycobacterium sp. GA-2829]
MHADPSAGDGSQEIAATRAALLRRAYEGEIIGCAMYGEMLDGNAYPETTALRLLYDIERITADALAPLITRYGVPVSDDDAAREGRRLAATLAGRPWKEMWMDVIRLADDYLTDFRLLVDVLDGEEAAVGRQVVAHEEALIAFAHHEIDEAGDALAPLEDYRRRYAVNPPSLSVN